jgi:hypothetical protein
MKERGFLLQIRRSAMKVFSLIVALTMLLTACGVSRFKSSNWNPNRGSRDVDYYECLQEAQQSVSRAFISAGRTSAVGGARSGAETNTQLLVSCMEAKGYRMRDMTGGEVAVTFITLPLSIPFAILGANVQDFY